MGGRGADPVLAKVGGARPGMLGYAIDEATGEWLSPKALRERHGGRVGNDVADELEEVVGLLRRDQRAEAWRQGQPDEPQCTARDASEGGERVGSTTMWQLEKIVAARRTAECFGGWEYLISWRGGARTWESKHVLDPADAGPQVDEEHRREMRDEMEDARTNHCRPRDLREVLEEHGRSWARGVPGRADAWLADVIRGDPRNARVATAFNQALDVYLEYAQQIAIDVGVDGKEYNVAEVAKNECTRGREWGLKDCEEQTLYRGKAAKEKVQAQGGTAKKAQGKEDAEGAKRRIHLGGNVKEGELARRVAEW